MNQQPKDIIIKNMKTLEAPDLRLGAIVKGEKFPKRNTNKVPMQTTVVGHFKLRTLKPALLASNDIAFKLDLSIK